MLTEDKVAFSVLGAIVCGLVAWVGFTISDERQEYIAYQAARKVEIDTFYTAHKCVPEGYVATKYDPIRTYRCDNGLYVVADMK